MRACVIVDENVQDLVWGNRTHERCDYRNLHRGLTYGKRPCSSAVMAICGQLLVRYSAAMLLWLEEADRQGRSESVDDGRVKVETAWVEESGLCSSPDPEDRMILGLARASGARVLATNDDALSDDFRNSKIVDPPGVVYRNPSHNKALQRRCRQANRRARTR